MVSLSFAEQTHRATCPVFGALEVMSTDKVRPEATTGKSQIGNPGLRLW